MVAIKDMEMPKSCLACPLAYPRWDFNIGCEVCKAILGHHEDYGRYETERHPDCPLTEIVTCKDCKYYRVEDDDEYCTNHTIKDNKFWVREDYFCADGEKK